LDDVVAATELIMQDRLSEAQNQYNH
ncbi:hypothetical protein EVA_21352, partial [gut metagenome]